MRGVRGELNGGGEWEREEEGAVGGKGMKRETRKEGMRGSDEERSENVSKQRKLERKCKKYGRKSSKALKI